MAGPPNAILAISSTDRYITNLKGNANQPFSNALEAQYNNSAPYANDFQITAPNALMNGYIEKIVISQIQLQYNLPTIVPNGNDLLAVGYEISQQSGIYNTALVSIPYGFYNPDEIAAIIQARLDVAVPLLAPWRVIYTSSAGDDFGFQVFSENSNGYRFYFPTPTQLRALLVTELEITRYLKMCKLLGFNSRDSFPSNFGQISWVAPDFLYTPYVDIYSDALTNYQRLKDTDSSTSRRKGLLSRIYLSGIGNPQLSSAAYVNQDGLIIVPSTALGCSPFVLTFDLNSPKIINWTPDTAINSLDFQMRDCYGDLLFNYDTAEQYGQVTEVFNTEFQMTLLCVEKKY